MTYATLIVGGIVVITWTVGMLTMFAWARSEVKARGVEQDGRLEAVRNKDKAERERNDALAAQTKAESERDAAVKAALVFERAAKVARKELEKHVAEKMVTGSDDDVSAEVDRLLGAGEAADGAGEATAGGGGALSTTLRSPELP